MHDGMNSQYGLSNGMHSQYGSQQGMNQMNGGYDNGMQNMHQRGMNGMGMHSQNQMNGGYGNGMYNERRRFLDNDEDIDAMDDEERELFLGSILKKITDSVGNVFRGKRMEKRRDRRRER